MSAPGESKGETKKPADEPRNHLKSQRYSEKAESERERGNSRKERSLSESPPRCPVRSSHYLLLTPDVTVQVPQQCVQLLGSSTSIVQLLL